MLAKNREERETGSPPTYLGFRLLLRSGLTIHPDKIAYRNAVLPISVAQAHPKLLELAEFDYQTVYCSERFPLETRFVVRPGAFITLEHKKRRLKWLKIGGILLIIGLTFAVYFWLA